MRVMTGAEPGEIREAEKQERRRRPADEGHAEFDLDEAAGKILLDKSRQPSAQAECREIDADDD